MPRAKPTPGKPFKRFPYVWVTTIAKVLGGDMQCWFAAWKKSHYQLAKRPENTFDKESWSADHDRLVDLRAIQLAADGWVVKRERENEWKVGGKKALLSGKCDIIAYKPGFILFSDGKTGEKRRADFWQVLIYIWAMPMARSGFGMGCRVDGEVVYGHIDDEGKPVIDSIAPVPFEELTEARDRDIEAAMNAMKVDEPPAAIPSGSECKMCDVCKEDCTFYVEEVVGTTERF